MTKQSDPFMKVRWEAELLLRELKIEVLPIDPFEIARRLDIDLQPMPADEGGASGMLLHVNGQFGICYPTHVRNDRFKRFSLAHEIVHFRLPGHVDAIFDDNGRHVSRAGFKSADSYEQEADHFAAALLMRDKLFGPAIKRAGDGLKAIISLADDCDTSLEATAIRYVQVSQEPMAIIRSQNQTIDYAFMSESLKDFSDLNWIRKGTPLPAGSITASFNEDKGTSKNW